MNLNEKDQELDELAKKNDEKSKNLEKRKMELKEKRESISDLEKKLDEELCQLFEQHLDLDKKISKLEAEKKDNEKRMRVHDMSIYNYGLKLTEKIK